MHLGKCCHRAVGAPVAFGKADIPKKSKGDIFNGRLIFFHLYDVSNPTGNSYEQTQEVRGGEVPVIMLLELSEEEGWKPAAWNSASIRRIKRNMVEGEADGEGRNKDIESTEHGYMSRVRMRGPNSSSRAHGQK